MKKRNSRANRHFFICLFISVLFSINLYRTYSDTGELPTGGIFFTAAVYLATLLSAWSLKETPKKK